MIIPYYDPDDYEMHETRTTCSFHKQNPGIAYAGCCCSASYTMRKKEKKDPKPKRFVVIDPKTDVVILKT